METTRARRTLDAAAPIGAGALAGAACLWLAPWIPHRWWGASACGVALLGCAAAVRGARGRAALLALSVAVLAIFGSRLAATAAANVRNPPEWDFQIFWIDAKALAAGANVYKTEEVLPFAPASGLSQELLDSLASLYPPPTLLFFQPIAWFDLPTAFFLWYCLNAAVVAACVALAWRLFLADLGGAGLALAAALLALLRPTLQTVQFGQTNFLVLLFLLLAWRDRLSARAGVWLALGVFAKPVLAIVLLAPLALRRWRVLVSAAATALVALAASAAAFGFRLVATYFTENPVAHEMPLALYKEAGSQGLLATILRETGVEPDPDAPLTNIPYWVACAALGAASFWLADRARPRGAERALALAVPFALLVYPKTLEHYSVVLFAPLLWVRRVAVGSALALAAAGFLALEIALLARGFRCTFAANLLAWTVFAGVALAAARASKPTEVAKPNEATNPTEGTAP